jgi:hypothetical protein
MVRARNPFGFEIRIRILSEFELNPSDAEDYLRGEKPRGKKPQVRPEVLRER